MEKEVVVFSKPACGKCMFVKSLLKGNGVEFSEINVMEDEDAFNFVKENGSALPVTKIVVDGVENVVRGFDEKQIKSLLAL